MTNPVQIYVRLLEEAVDVWRPIEAELLGDSIYRIISRNDTGGDEIWEFEAGDDVLCESRVFQGEAPVLVAIARAPRESMTRLMADENQAVEASKHAGLPLSPESAAAMTVNERLYAAGLLSAFDEATRRQDVGSLRSILAQVHLSTTDVAAVIRSVLPHRSEE